MKSQSGKNTRLIAAGAFGLSAVAIGAFGAHALKLEGKWEDIYGTASLYHLIHSVLLIALALQNSASPWFRRAFTFSCMGIAIFSGTLYALAITQIKILGAVTPIGGVFLMLGWVMLIMAGLKTKSP